MLEVELFENFSKQHSYDSKVRVYMYNLRKKIDEYYQTEGAKDELRFSIAKGQYNLSVNPNKSVRTKNRVLQRLIASIVISTIAILVLVLFLRKKDLYCWDSYFQSDLPTIYYVGDHYTAYSNEGPTNGYSIHWEGVKSEFNFDSLVKAGKLDPMEFKKVDYSLVTKMGPIAASRLTEWFVQHKKPLTVSMESDFLADNLNNSNMLCIGPFKTLNGLSAIF